MVAVPRLETERLILREWRRQDFDWYASMATDADVRRFIGGTQSRTDAWRTFAGIIGHWYLRGHSFWVVERKSDQVPVGALGVLRHESWPGLEVGWQLAREHWGKGYATEGARVAQDWAFATQPVDAVISCIDPENVESQRVAARLGNTRGRRIPIIFAGRNVEVDIWELKRSDWQKSGRKPPKVLSATELKPMPRIETERLIMREWRHEDIAPSVAMMADEMVTRYTVGSPQSPIDAWRSLTAIVGHWYLRGYGFWAIECKEDNKFIGRIGMWNPEGWPGLEVGWTLARPYWGKGYATEAARASMDFAFNTQPIDRLLSVIHVDNAPSQAVASRLGQEKGERRDLEWGGRTFPIDLWSITRKQWEANRTSPRG